jgi:hypothetical protein
VTLNSFCPFAPFARTLAFLAAVAFLLQGLAVSASQAAAAAGLMADPAVELTGAVHFHGHLAGHVHSHDGDNLAGHVHVPAGTDHDDHTDAGSAWALFSPSLDIPANGALQYSASVCDLMPMVMTESATGLAPPSLIRPPSTPSIA